MFYFIYFFFLFRQVQSKENKLQFTPCVTGIETSPRVNIPKATNKPLQCYAFAQRITWHTRLCNSRYYIYFTSVYIKISKQINKYNDYIFLIFIYYYYTCACQSRHAEHLPAAINCKRQLPSRRIIIPRWFFSTCPCYAYSLACENHTRKRIVNSIGYQRHLLPHIFWYFIFEYRDFIFRTRDLS